jgi:signal transduction histidine kinase
MTSSSGPGSAALQLLQASLSKPAVLRAALAAALAECRAREAALLLPLGPGRPVELYLAGGRPRLRIKRTRLPALRGLEHWVWSSGRPARWPAGRRSPGPDDLRGLVARSSFPAPQGLAVPVASARRTLGVLMVRQPRARGSFPAAALSRLRAVAALTGPVLEHARRHSALQDTARKLRRQVRTSAAQLRRATQTQSRADQANSEMISIIAHELRTPITSIAGFAKLLLAGRSGPLTGEQQQFCQIIHRNSGNVERLITDLLDIRNLEQGVLELRQEELSLAALVREAVQTQQACFPEQERRVSLDLPETAVRVRGDRLRLVQVVANLLSNAHKYSPPGTPIGVRLVREASTALFSVRNQGLALRPEELEKVFEKFYRIQSPATRHIAGSGLGLAIAKHIILGHGGVIWAENAAPDGMDFKFRLPLL